MPYFLFRKKGTTLMQPIFSFGRSSLDSLCIRKQLYVPYYTITTFNLYFSLVHTIVSSSEHSCNRDTIEKLRVTNREITHSIQREFVYPLLLRLYAPYDQLQIIMHVTVSYLAVSINDQSFSRILLIFSGSEFQTYCV